MALYLVVRWDAARSREVGINRDGSVTDTEHSELFSRRDAVAIAREFRGQPVRESDYWDDSRELDD